MNIIEFIPAFSRLTETFLYNFVHELQERESNTRVLTFHHENLDCRPFPYVDLHPAAHNDWAIKSSRFSPLLRPLFYRVRAGHDASVHEQLLRYFRDNNVDLVHAHYADAAYTIADACASAGIPLVISLRGYDASRTLQRRRWRILYRWIFRRSAAVVLVSNEMRTRIAPLVPDHVPLITIHAGKDPSQYEFKCLSPPIVRLLSIGRLVEKKGHSDAIRAIHFAREQGTEVTLDIIGDGPLRAKLEEQIVQCNLQEVVKLHSSLPHDQAMRLLSQADGFVLACKTASDGDMEGIPNVLKEAQLYGIPVISTHHGGIPYALPETNHDWLAAEGDWKSLGELVVRLSKISQTRLDEITSTGRRHIEVNFSLDSEVGGYLSLFESIIDRQ